MKQYTITLDLYEGDVLLRRVDIVDPPLTDRQRAIEYWEKLVVVEGETNQ